MKKRVCTILCLITLLGFITMFVQARWHPFKLKPLKGFTPIVESPEFSIDSFASGIYQDNVERYISENFGFREFFIRLYNQFTYSCFHKINNENIVEGANQELYWYMYLDDLTGVTLKEHYADVEEAKADARKNVEETLRLVDTLRAHNTDFLFVFAPTKTAVYPEKMPQWYQEQISDFSLEEYYIKLFKENGIPHIDFYNYFKSIKDSFPYPLYTRTGTHWSEATIPFVADSILKKLDAITKYKLPSVRYIDDNLTTDYSAQDGELEADMNLLFPMNKPALPRPIFELTDTLGPDKPNLLVVCDSYFTQLRVSPFVKAFKNWESWVYNEDIESSNKDHKWKRLDMVVDAEDVLDDADIVMAVFTAPMLYDYMFGFTETVQNLYAKGVISDEAGLNAVIQHIKESEQWMHDLEVQAQERGITLEENILLNAKWYIEERHNTRKQSK